MEFVVFQFFINYKRTVTLIAFSVLVIYAPVAQSRHDFTWVLGFSQDGTSLKPGGTIVDFNYSPPKTSYLQLPALSISSYCSMSDAHGRLLFYTNGCDLFNADHEVMQNGHGMNFGKKYSEYCVELALGYPSQHGWITLPMIGDTEKYIIVSLNVDEETFQPKCILHAIVDMSKDGGRGAVLQKNALVMQDTALQDILCAVRHANGRDWWIVVPTAVAPFGIFTILLAPEGFGPPTFHPVSPHLYDQTNGQACFSPDGEKYCINQSRYVYVFDFDRCSGTFSGKQSWQLPIDNSVPFTAGGIAVSPNSEYLYVSTGAHVHQYALKAPNIASTRVLLTENHDPKLTFGNLALAPDNKIYGMPFGNSNLLHVVQNPDVKGLDCHFEYNAFQIPTSNFIVLPYFPSYRLYDLVGSDCDTICVNNPENGNPYTASDIKIFPNPTRDRLRFNLPLCPCGQWEIYNIGGVLMHTFPANSQDGPYYELNVASWPSGVYILRGYTKARKAYAKRFVVIK